jgi:RNA polymerase sigma factor (sigma-70 family)
MTKKDLEQLKDMKIEIRLLTQDIERSKRYLVSDSVEGSSPSFPYCKHRIVITGVDMSIHKTKLNKQLEEALENLQKKLFNIENDIEQIDDSQTRNIVRLYYRNGLTQKQIGQELGYDQSIVSRKLKVFIDILTNK